MCTSVRLMLLECLGTWLYLSLGGLGTLSQPYIPAITWGASLTVGSLLGGQSSHLNPAVTIGMSASGLSSVTSLPCRIVGQLCGGLLAGITVYGVAAPTIIDKMVTDVNNTNTDWAEPWFTLPVYGSTMFTDILTFTIAATMFQLVFCASSGSALYHGISLATIITVFGPSFGAGLNPAREVMGRVVVSYFHNNWGVFMIHHAWAWIPLAWSFSGCLTGGLIYWICVKVPKHFDTNKKRGDSDKKADIVVDDETVSMILNERLVVEKPKTTPIIRRINETPSEQLNAYLDNREVTPNTIKKFCKKNQISTPELEHYLERYKAVPVDHLDLGNGVTVKVVSRDGSDEENV